jgi:hypothetical protein
MTPSKAIEEAKAALKPFADLAESYGPEMEDAYCIENMYPGLTIRDCRRASRALAALSGAAVHKAPADQIRALQDAIEGECDGLALSAQSARKILAFVFPAVSGVTEGWRAIESAPRDGTEVLTYRGAGLQAVAFWSIHFWWVTDGIALTNVTHWQPLLPPPENQETET